jgi:hypothetical protein
VLPLGAMSLLRRRFLVNGVLYPLTTGGLIDVGPPLQKCFIVSYLCCKAGQFTGDSFAIFLDGSPTLLQEDIQAEAFVVLAIQNRFHILVENFSQATRVPTPVASQENQMVAREEVTDEGEDYSIIGPRKVLSGSTAVAFRHTDGIVTTPYEEWLAVGPDSLLCPKWAPPDGKTGVAKSRDQRLHAVIVEALVYVNVRRTVYWLWGLRNPMGKTIPESLLEINLHRISTVAA